MLRGFTIANLIGGCRSCRHRHDPWTLGSGRRLLHHHERGRLTTALPDVQVGQQAQRLSPRPRLPQKGWLTCESRVASVRRGPKRVPPPTSTALWRARAHYCLVCDCERPLYDCERRREIRRHREHCGSGKRPACFRPRARKSPLRARLDAWPGVRGEIAQARVVGLTVPTGALLPMQRVASAGRRVAAASRSTGKSSERSSWRLLGHESDSAAVLAAGTSHAIGKRLCGRIVGTSVAPEFTPKHNSELSDNRGRRPHDAVRLEFGEEQVAGRRRSLALHSCWLGYRGAARADNPGAELEEVLQVAVVATLGIRSPSRRAEVLRR